MAKQTTSERFDRLAQEYTLKAAALKLAAEILNEEDRKTAVAAAPQKFLKAIAHRNGDERSHGEKRVEQIGQYVAAHPGASTRDIAAGLAISTPTVLKWIWDVAKPVEKRARGSKLPWNWISKASPSLQAPTTRTRAGRAGMKAKRRVHRQTAASRRDEITQYLKAHDGADTNEIAAGLGWQPKQVLKFAPQVAHGFKGEKSISPRQWYLGTRGKKAKTTKRKKVFKPTAEWLADIKAYLSTHPEAFTVEIAKAVRRHPNSGFVKLVRQVAKPARATTATQPIPWVLTEA